MTATSLSAIEQTLCSLESTRLQTKQRAAVALIWRERDAQLELLLIKRAEHPQDPWSGQMALPGGKVDPSDASPLAAAIRETREEVGVDLERQGRLLGRIDDVQARARAGMLDMAITPFVFAATEGGLAVERLKLDRQEVDEAHWISAKELLDPQAASTMQYPIGEKTLTLPCLHVRERTVWGLTHHMLQSFFSAVKWVG